MTNWDSYEEVNAFVMDYESEILDLAYKEQGLEYYGCTWDGLEIDFIYLGDDHIVFFVSRDESEKSKLFGRVSIGGWKIPIDQLKKLGTEVIDDTENGFRRGE